MVSSDENERVVKSYLLLSILVTLVCLPVGAFAIKYAVDAQEKYKVGDYASAKIALQRSKRLCIAGIAIAVLVFLIGFIGWSYEWWNFGESAVVPDTNQRLPETKVL